MKKILLAVVILVAMLSAGSVSADSCSARLVSAFGPQQAIVACRAFGMGQSTTETVASAGSVQGNGPLSATKFTHLVTGFDETKVVTLPSCSAGYIANVHWIYNAVSNKFAKIFPATGDQINANGVNAAYTSGATGIGGKMTECVCSAANQWYCG